MRLALPALAVVALLVLLRRRRTDPAVVVVVASLDGEEVVPDEGTPEHRRIVEAAERALA
jgi:hypothetical protein